MECALMNVSQSSRSKGYSGRIVLSGVSPARRLFDMKDTDRERRLRGGWSTAPLTVETVSAEGNAQDTARTGGVDGRYMAVEGLFEAPSSPMYAGEQDFLSFELIPSTEPGTAIDMDMAAFEDIQSEVASFFSDESVEWCDTDGHSFSSGTLSVCDESTQQQQQQQGVQNSKPAAKNVLHVSHSIAKKNRTTPRRPIVLATKGRSSHFCQVCQGPEQVPETHGAKCSGLCGPDSARVFEN